MERLDRELRDLADKREPAVRPVDTLERRARARRRRILGLQAATIIAVVGTVLVPGYRVISDNGVVGPDRPGRVVPAAPATPTPSNTSPSGTCGTEGLCDSANENLPEAEKWLGSTLDAANLAYRSDYRADGGGGHFVPAGRFILAALRPTEEEPAKEAAEYGHGPLWNYKGTVIYGTTESSIWYFYWRAGDVEMFAETVYPPSRRERLEKLQGLFERIIDEANRHPYPETP